MKNVYVGILLISVKCCWHFLIDSFSRIFFQLYYFFFILILLCFFVMLQEDDFCIYTKYCTNYPKAVDVLTECMQDPFISDFFREQQAQLNHGLALGAYLLKPVQRILKYHLLFQVINLKSFILLTFPLLKKEIHFEIHVRGWRRKLQIKQKIDTFCIMADIIKILHLKKMILSVLV